MRRKAVDDILGGLQPDHASVLASRSLSVLRDFLQAD